MLKPKTSHHPTYNHVPLRETDDDVVDVDDDKVQMIVESSTLYHDSDNTHDDDYDSALPSVATIGRDHSRRRSFEPLEMAASIRSNKNNNIIVEDERGVMHSSKGVGDAYEEEHDVDDDDNLGDLYDSSSSLPSYFSIWMIIMSVNITFWVSVPTLLGTIWMLYHLTGRIWTASLFVLHLALTLWTARFSLASAFVLDTNDSFSPNNNNNNYHGYCRCFSAGMSCIMSHLARWLDLLLFGVVYTTLYKTLILVFCTEPDGTTVVEWTTLKRHLILLRVGAIVVVILRCCLGMVAWSVWCVQHPNYCGPFPRWCGTFLMHCIEQLQKCSSHAYTMPLAERTKVQGRIRLSRRLCCVLQLLALILGSWCTYSVIVHWCDWPTLSSSSSPSSSSYTNNNDDSCDARDTTECCLPFPSFHHMQRDDSTVTGWRVHLRGNELPPLRGHVHLDPTFLNQLDGFSTMAPLLFYMEGLKEAHEQQQQQKSSHPNTSALSTTARLQGHLNLAESVTNQSVTLLLDVQAHQLVHHSAEIDYLDPDNPLVLIFPASPLNHNTHYALAVVNAVDQFGTKLAPTLGMQTVLSTTTTGGNDTDQERYRHVVLPSLATAAPWFSRSQDSLQLLFDFHTISAESQLGPVRAVRDATLNYIQSSPLWGNWSDHVRVIRKYDNNCRANGTLIARTIHASLDVPWFLNGYGSGYRSAVLDPVAVASGQPATIGHAKFVVHIPCSLRAAALNESDYHGRPPVELRAVMEYGHGLFFTRAEASDHFLWRMANEEGYIIMAMDWRGMSAFDLPIVTKTLMSTPRLFQAVRDNLIQGYANKFALQHFAQNRMLSMDWMHFRTGFRRAEPIPTYQGQAPTFVFYGISQGGILGAGYSALSGPTGLIARSILGVPGTPFALIMSRSLDFAGYDQILLRNFYSNRHVRILLSLVQMAWDSVEGSGVLAQPITEPFPRMLLQAGLGDAVVPTIAAEALARALGACILPNNPIQPFGLPLSPPANETWDGPNVTLTELLYQPEYKSLPEDDEYAMRNDVHVCVRRDRKLISQITEFINTGRVIDPCKLDGCIRKRARCFGHNLTDEVYS